MTTPRYRKPENILFYKARARAKRTNRECDIGIEDIVIPPYCPYFGTVLAVAKGRADYNSPTLDRIDNSRGYVKGNIEVISYRANTLKSDLTLLEMKQVALAFWARAKDAA